MCQHPESTLGEQGKRSPLSVKRQQVAVMYCLTMLDLMVESTMLSPWMREME